MSQNQLAERVKKLEDEVLLLRSALEQQRLVPKRDWWRDAAGMFRDDPDFEEAARLGRDYRKSLDRKPRKKVKSKAAR